MASRRRTRLLRSPTRQFDDLDPQIAFARVPFEL
jgi:hypothetical protein